MENDIASRFFLGDYWTGWRRWIAWLFCISFIILIGVLRTETDVELAFASIGLLPVLSIAWIGGKRNGVLMAFFASFIWIMADLITDRQFSAQWIPWANAATRLATYSLVAILAAKVRLEYEVTHDYATHDALTGLLNRRAFLTIGNSEVTRSKRYGHPMAVVFLDLDDFKILNDSIGHAAGDAALQLTAKTLITTLRKNDQIARLGGDEFAILLPEIGFDESVEAANKISHAANRALTEFSSVTASVGVAWFREADGNFSDMLNAADQLMYKVKANGKGTICAESICINKNKD